MLSHTYNIVIGRGIGAPVNCKDVVKSLNSNDKLFLSMLMTTVQLPGENTNYSHMEIHTTMSNTDISPARVFKNHLSDPTRANVLIDHGKYGKQASEGKWP